MSNKIQAEQGAGLKWSQKWHPMGRMTNLMSDIKYLPNLPPDPTTLDAPLRPIDRAELREYCHQYPRYPLQDHPTYRDYYHILRKPHYDLMEGSKYQQMWLDAYPERAIEVGRLWDDFFAQHFPNPKP